MNTNIGVWFKANEQWMGPIGVLVGLLGIVLSVYFYLSTRQAGEVALRFHTVKIAEAGIPGIKIFDSENKPISGTVFGCEIIVWNSGNLSLGEKANLTREPLTIIFSSDVSIIEAVVQDTINVSGLITLDRKDNRISISWSQFDPGDAFKLFIIYSGKTQSSIDYRGRFLLSKITDLSQFEEEHPELDGFAAFRSKLTYGLEHRPLSTILVLLYVIAIPITLVPLFSRKIRESKWALVILIFVVSTFVANGVSRAFEHFSTSNPFQ